MKTSSRVYHPWWDWECYKAGFFGASAPGGADANSAKLAYAKFLGDLEAFDAGISLVFNEWPRSCEQWLTNESMNRIAWLGQAAACAVLGLPSRFRAGFKLLSPDQQIAANKLADRRLQEWLQQRSC